MDVALVLGGGGARGFAHIGAIEVLQAHGYHITSVAGTSMGALVGGLFVAGKMDKLKAIADLNVVPVSVSYEWEPCDVLKTLELYESQFTKYTKKPGEDLNSILTGIMQKKGRVHFEICKPITEAELRNFADMTNHDYYQAVSRLIDKRIVKAYRLFPNNYIAYDLRYGCSRFSDRYTQEEKDRFVSYLRRLDRYDTCDVEQLTDIFLGIYANPIVNKTKQNDRADSSCL